MTLKDYQELYLKAVRLELKVCTTLIIAKYGSPIAHKINKVPQSIPEAVTSVTNSIANTTEYLETLETLLVLNRLSKKSTDGQIRLAQYKVLSDNIDTLFDRFNKLSGDLRNEAKKE